RIGCLGQCAKPAHDRVLPARYPMHRCPLSTIHQPLSSRCLVLKSNSSMKDRILKRFNDEIAALERELKIDLPKEIQRAREYGDLRENAEYKAAKERQEI